MTEIRKDPSRLYLYALADGSFGGTDPPILAELLGGRDVQAAATLARIAFSLPMLPHFCWDADSAWLDCHVSRFPGFCDPMFSDAADFISAFPDLQAWLGAWSKSERRSPDPTPSWARQRQLDGKLVVNFARSVEHHLSTPKTCAIRFCDPDGQDVWLSIPPSASLSLPPPVPDRRGAVHVVGKEDMAWCCMPTGTEVLLSARDLGESTIPIVVNPRYLRMISVTSAGRIHALSGAPRTEAPA